MSDLQRLCEQVTVLGKDAQALSSGLLAHARDLKRTAARIAVFASRDPSAAQAVQLLNHAARCCQHASDHLGKTRDVGDTFVARTCGGDGGQQAAASGSTGSSSGASSESGSGGVAGEAGASAASSTGGAVSGAESGGGDGGGSSGGARDSPFRPPNDPPNGDGEPGGTPRRPRSSAVTRHYLRIDFAKQAQAGEEGTIIAGVGGRAPLRDVRRLVSEYGGTSADWVKKASSAFTTSANSFLETHWYENIRTGQRVEFKFKHQFRRGSRG